MMSFSSISRAGMNTAQAALNTSANNIANMNTPGFQRQEVRQTARTESGVSAAPATTAAGRSALEADVVTQLQAKNAFLANLAVFKTSDKMAGALLDMSA